MININNNKEMYDFVENDETHTDQEEEYNETEDMPDFDEEEYDETESDQEEEDETESDQEEYESEQEDDSKPEEEHDELFPFIDKPTMNSIIGSSLLVLIYISCIIMIIPTHILLTGMFAIFIGFFSKYLIFEWKEPSSNNSDLIVD